MSKIRIGVIGGGGISNAHLPRLKSRSDAVELVGVADVNADAAKAQAEKYGMPKSVTDYRDLLPHVDAVLVCVPTHLHGPMAVDAINAGKHVFCEKPLTRTIEQAEAIQAAMQKSGGRTAFQVGYVRRFDDEWLAWRDAVRDEMIGRPIVWRDIGAFFFNVAPWFTQEDKGGGPFIDGCVHNYDFGLYTFGPVEWVFSHMRTMRQGNTALDTGTTTLRFASGDELLLAWSWGLAEGTSGTRVFELLGPKGTMHIPGDEPEPGKNRILITRAGGEKQNLTYPKNALGRAFELQMDEFIEVCQGKRQPRAGLKEGLESLRVALAVLESGRSGEKVYVESQKR